MSAIEQIEWRDWRYIPHMLRRAASKPSPRLPDPSSPRDDTEQAASVEWWLDQLRIEMDALTELATVVADRTGETVTQSRREHRAGLSLTRQSHAADRRR
jgi:hypothetical protein